MQNFTVYLGIKTCYANIVGQPKKFVLWEFVLWEIVLGEG